MGRSSPLVTAVAVLREQRGRHGSGTLTGTATLSKGGTALQSDGPVFHRRWALDPGSGEHT